MSFLMVDFPKALVLMVLNSLLIPNIIKKKVVLFYIPIVERNKIKLGGIKKKKNAFIKCLFKVSLPECQPQIRFQEKVENAKTDC